MPQDIQFLFIRARTVSEWFAYPTAPPPLNLLGMPYFIYLAARKIAVLCGIVSTAHHKNPPPEFEPPVWFLSHLGDFLTDGSDVAKQEWEGEISREFAKRQRFGDRRPFSGDHFLGRRRTSINVEALFGLADQALITEGLTVHIMSFVSEHTDEVVREDRWKTQVLRTIFG
eukprot:6136846-Prymnesium_polylepis.3